MLFPMAAGTAAPATLESGIGHLPSRVTGAVLGGFSPRSNQHAFSRFTSQAISPGLHRFRARPSATGAATFAAWRPAADGSTTDKPAGGDGPTCRRRPPA